MNHRRRILRRVLFVVLGLLVLYVGARVIGGAISASRLEAELQRVHASGIPLTPNEAMPLSVPDPENAAVVLRRAFALLVEEPEALWENEGWWEALYENPRALSEDAVRIVEAWVRENEPALTLVEEAVRRPSCVFERDWSTGIATPADHIPGLMGASRALSARAALQIRDGDADSALVAASIQVRLGRLTRKSPTLVEMLVGTGTERIGLGIAAQALSAGAPSEKAVRDMLAVVEPPPPDGFLAPVSTFERALGNVTLDQYDHDEQERLMGTLDDGNGMVSAALTFLFPTTARRLDHARFLDLMGRVIELGAGPYLAQKSEWDALRAEVEDRPWYDELAHAVLVAHLFGGTRWETYRAAVDLARIGLRVELYALREGRLPATLDALDVPGGLSDRFRDAPYVYRPESDGGYVLYSVGPEGTGELGREKAVDELDEDDIVWRRTAREP